MTQQHPGAPRPKNNGPQCARNIDTTCPLFLPSPLTLHPSFSTSLVHSRSPLAGREQGMLIKGCENQEKKRRAHTGTKEKDSRQRMARVWPWIGYWMEIERWGLQHKQWPGNEWVGEKKGMQRKIDDNRQHKHDRCGLLWQGYVGFPGKFTEA